MENSTQTDFSDIVKDIYAKLNNIQAVLGYILEKTKLNKIDDNLDARDAEGTVLPV